MQINSRSIENLEPIVNGVCKESRTLIKVVVAGYHIDQGRAGT